jgi:DNA-binding response OmpR family regulator
MAGLKNVIIVEDDAMIRELYVTVLVDSGYNIETAISADELYQKLVNFHADCILLDLMLPGVSGLEILQELKSNPAHNAQTAKIVLLTNMSQGNVRDNAIKSGADAYVIKADILPTELPKIISSLED